MTEPSLPLVLLAAALFFSSLAASVCRRSRRRKHRPAAPTRPVWSIKAVLAHLESAPFDQRSPQEQKEIVDRLRAVDQGPISMREHGRVNLILGEISLQKGDREQARRSFRAALLWDPRLPIRRTLERLENPTPLSFTSRRAA